MIKAIIFDCFGVLTTDTWKEFVATLPTDQIEQASTFNHAYDAGKITKAEFLHSVEKLTGSQPVYVDDLLDNETDKNIQLLAHIKDLKSTYKIGLLSNVATRWIEDYFLTPDEVKLFDDMVLSFEVGMTKPEPQIFKLSCEKLGVESAEAVLVDDVDRYCDAARATGMQAICYQDFQQFKTELEQILSHA